MASITQRGGRYTVRVRQRGFATVTRTFTKRADAAAWARRVESDMEAGRWGQCSEQLPTLRDAIGVYRTTVAAAMKGAATYVYRFDEFSSLSFAVKRVDAVTPADLSTWRDEQLKKFKPGTVVRKLAMLSAVFSWCVRERGWLQKNPADNVTRPRVLDRRDRLLSPEEWRYLTQAARSSKAEWLLPALTLLASSAMRRGELFSLRRGQVDFAASVAYLPDTKSGRPRYVPLSPSALRAMGELLAVAPKGADAPLLPIGAVGSVSTRFKVTIRRARCMYEAACNDSGTTADPAFLSNVRLHDMRHHAITSAVSRGDLSLPELMAISGHSRPEMLMRYTHLSATKIAEKLALDIQS